MRRSKGWLYWVLTCYLTKIFEIRIMFGRINASISRLGIPANGRVLVIGAGIKTLRILRPLKRFGEIIATDSDWRSVRYIRQAHRKAKHPAAMASFYTQDLTSSLYQEGSFDLVVCFNLAEAISRQETLNRLQKLVRAGGHLILTLPHLAMDYDKMLSEHEYRDEDPKSWLLRFALQALRQLRKNDLWLDRLNFFTLSDINKLDFGFGNVTVGHLTESKTNWLINWRCPLIRQTAELSGVKVHNV